MDKAFFSGESLTDKTSSVINFLKLFFLKLLKKSRGLIYKNKIVTKTVFTILILVKSLKGLK